VSIFSTFKNSITLVRPGNLLLTILGTLIGGALGRISGGETDSWMLPLAALASGLIAAGGYAINDAFDRKEDLVNHPERPVPSGVFSSQKAGGLGIVLLISGSVVSWFVSFTCGIFAVIIVLLLIIYSVRLKSKAIVGNTLVAICGAAPLLFGALAAGKLEAGLLAFSLAAPLHLIREIVKDVEDLEGDSIAGRKTHPIIHSKLKSIRLAGILMLLLAIYIPIPYFMKWMGLPYLVIAGLFAAFPLAYFGGGTIAYPESVNAGKIQRILKLLMVSGMIAIIAGTVIR